MSKDFNQVVLLLTCLIVRSWLRRGRGFDGEGTRGTGHGLISAIHGVRGDECARVGERNCAVGGDLVCQRRTDRVGSEITVVTVDDPGAVGLVKRTVPKPRSISVWAAHSVVHAIVISYASVRNAP